MSTFPPPVNPSDLGRGPLVIGLTWTFTSLALIVVGLRFWVRISVTKKLHVEDWLMFVAVLLQLACQSCLTVAFHYGFGKHDRDLTFEQLVNVGKWGWMQFTPGITASILSRISIAILLVRLFGVHSRLKWSVIILAILQVVGGVVVTITSWVQVRPVRALWNPLIPAERLSPNVVAREGNVTGFFFALGDLCYVLFPVIVVWKLNMPLRQKLGLCMLLALSLFTMGCSIAKAVVAESGTSSSSDQQYKSSLALMWSLFEQAFVIMMGCAPPLRSLTRLELPVVDSLSTSMKRLFSSRGSESVLESSTGLGQSKNGMYYELGVAGQSGSEVQAGTMNSAFHQTYNSRIDPKKILRTDHFVVKSDGAGDP